MSMITFVLGALGFVVFLTTLKPEPLSAVTALSKSANCKMAASRAPGCREPEWLAR
ncbi:hypothetical protein [Bradyrhizobium sp. Ec3.3]|uniref:hypothetical protein n=1 Tax=Bradyrhizobium sp. Ec3.3 TaxID=189753 RepID=UPI0012EBA3D4|nr:hypothetical protein [Bradyrhizobium sp. Ec3.3]